MRLAEIEAQTAALGAKVRELETAHGASIGDLAHAVTELRDTAGRLSAVVDALAAKAAPRALALDAMGDPDAGTDANGSPVTFAERPAPDLAGVGA